MLEDLIAVDQVELARPGRYRRECRMGGGAAKAFGLRDGVAGNVVADRSGPELLQFQCEDAVHAAKIQHLFAVGRKSSQQNALAPEQMRQPPLEIERARTLFVQPGVILTIVVRVGGGGLNARAHELRTPSSAPIRATSAATRFQL